MKLSPTFLETDDSACYMPYTSSEQLEFILSLLDSELDERRVCVAFLDPAWDEGTCQPCISIFGSQSRLPRHREVTQFALGCILIRGGASVPTQVCVTHILGLTWALQRGQYWLLIEFTERS